MLILAVVAATAAPVEGHCRAEPGGTTIANADGQPIHVRSIGAGVPILMIPSLARGAHDFDELAKMLAAQHFQSILPDPRATGDSTTEPAKDLFALADDDRRVIEALCTGKVDVLGHAFGNRVARALAVAAPDRVARLVLLAGGGEALPTSQTSAALQGSLAEGERSDQERLVDLRLAFFAKGNDASLWLRGWFPKAAVVQRSAGAATPTRLWWTAGVAPVLLVQPLEDPVAPPANAAALKRDLGDRLTLVALPHASHAILPEQPASVAAVISAYLGGDYDAGRLQKLVDADVR